MTAASLCPDARKLEELRLGRLSLKEVEELAQHLEECERCVACLGEINPDDALVGALRASTTGVDLPAADEVAELAAMLKKLFPRPADAQF